MAPIILALDDYLQLQDIREFLSALSPGERRRLIQFFYWQLQKECPIDPLKFPDLSDGNRTAPGGSVGADQEEQRLPLRAVSGKG